MLKLTANESSAVNVLQEQVETLEKRIIEMESVAKSEREELRSRELVLEKQVEIMEKQKKKAVMELENTVARLTAENEGLKKSYRGREEDWRQAALRDECADLKERIKRLEDDHKAMEKKYVEAKLAVSGAEMERDALSQKLKEAQDKLRDQSRQYTLLEVEFYKVNEHFGQTLNLQNELEAENQALKQKLGSKH